VGLSETKLIQSVSVTGRHLDYGAVADTASRFLGAIADNVQLALVDFSSCFPFHPHHQLLDLLRSKGSSLRYLKLNQLNSYDNPSWPEHDLAACASAFGALYVLESLTLEQFNNPVLSVMTLRQLASHTCLQELSIKGYHYHCAASFPERRVHNHDIVMAVASILKSDVPLKVLKLKEVCVSQQDMQSLVQGLESCSSLVDLTLNGSLLDEAKQELVRFLRADRAAKACTIRRLCLRDLAEAPESFLSVLTVAANELQPATTSVGSCLQALNLPSWFEDIDELLNALVASAHRLSSLSLGHLTDTSWLQLTRCLPSLLHLREFHLEYIYKGEASTLEFVRAMQKNGSLHRVSEISARSGDEPLFSTEEWQEIQSYCQRNLKMRELLQDPYLPRDDTRDINDKTLLSLFPKLFHAMKPAERVAPTYILAGVLACGGGGSGGCLIGPSGHGKRLGSMLSDAPFDNYL
jgi:hypothetical protein